MCGIVGVRSSGGGASAGGVVAMTDAIAHRGPDGAGFLLVDTRSGRVHDSRDGPAPDEPFDLALGSRRLAIVDLSPAGHMPMPDAERRRWIVHNGEVYNYAEIREELRKLGHRFRTDTDTEVILAAYMEWGHECLHRFNGMFAFAIWDGPERRLFCARDRFGVKPFYYHHDAESGLFVFGSEIKAILEHPGVPRRPNRAIVHDYLALGLVDHEDETFFEGVLRLPAGHALALDANGRFEMSRWYEAVSSSETDASEDEVRLLANQFRTVFTDAVRLRLRSDVPLGTCLSGGLDSSAIVVTANRLMFDELKMDANLVGGRQRTFSACFDDPRFDESKWVDIVTAATGADSHRIHPTAEEFWSDLERLVWHMDEPFQSTSQFSQWSVMKRVRQGGVTVTLDGQGADEMLAGYPGHYGVWLTTLICRGRLLRAAQEATRAARLGGRERRPLGMAMRVAYGMLPATVGVRARESLAPLLHGLLREGRMRHLMRPAILHEFRGRRRRHLALRASEMRNFGRRMHADLVRDSLPALLRYEDRNSMAFSLESRTPFLDYRLVELALAMPGALKIRGGWSKWILRHALDGILPPEVQWRKDKKGFVTPEVVWLRALAPRIRALFADERTLSGDFVDAERVLDDIDRYLEGTPDDRFYTELWRVVNLEVWMRVFFAPERVRGGT